MRVVQAFGRERSFTARFRDTNEDQYDANIETVRISAKYFPVVEFAGVAGTAVIVGSAAGSSTSDVVTVGTVAAFVLYLQQPVRAGPAAQPALQHRAVGGRGAAASSSACSTRRPSIAERPGAVDLPADGAIDVEDVTFAYGERAGAARRVAARSRAGERLALVGPTGAGQVDAGQADRALLRPDRGRGARRRRRPARRDAALAARAHRRRAAGGLPVRRHDPRQRARRPAGSHRRRGRRRARRARARSTASRRSPTGSTPRCASAARACRPGSGSSCRSRAPRSPTRRCSCSTRRRRTSTPAPSTSSSTRSNGSWRAARSIVVAHRLSTAARADRIAVVDDGRLAELGTHDELVALDGHYASLYRSWVAHHAEPGVTRG